MHMIGLCAVPLKPTKDDHENRTFSGKRHRASASLIVLRPMQAPAARPAAFTRSGVI
jgi:hypothetical protein